jgi:HD-GYP domain-containing protein (c-di-GMP phosphodiesterase class II)
MISTANLQLGMYVSQLDRPWLETPFLFKGFEIREDAELKLLRQFCRNVYVDANRGSLARDRVLAATRARQVSHQISAPDRVSNRPRSLRARLFHSISRIDPTGVIAARLYGHRHYRNSVSTVAEAPHAIRAYDAAAQTINEVLDQIQAGKGVEVAKVKAAAAPVVDSILRNQDAMAWLIYLRKRDEYAYHHSVASAVWAVILGRHLGFAREGLDTLALGGMLLDMGKARLPARVAGSTQKFTAAEIEAMKKHVRYGLDLARKTPGINADALLMIESHHERHDGSGYPAALRGADIPVFGRIGGLVDCYDAMTSPRPWAAAKSPYDAIRELNILAGIKFQKEMVEQFVQALGMFPTGSLVELNTGHVGLVIEQNHIRRLRPKLMIVLDAGQRPVSENRILDLRKLPSDQRDGEAYWIVKGLDAGAFGIDPKNYFIA